MYIRNMGCVLKIMCSFIGPKNTTGKRFVM